MGKVVKLEDVSITPVSYVKQNYILSTGSYSCNVDLFVHV